MINKVISSLAKTTQKHSLNQVYQIKALSHLNSYKFITLNTSNCHNLKSINNQNQFKFSQKLKFDKNGVLIEPTEEEKEEIKKNQKFSFALSRREKLGVVLIMIGAGMSFYFAYDDHIQRGNLLLEQQKYQEAIDHNANSWMWSNTAISHYQQAIGFMGIDNFEQALEQIDITIKENENFQSLRIKAHILQRMGKQNEAIEYFDRSEKYRVQAGF